MDIPNDYILPEGKLDNSGNLQIKRGSDWKAIKCVNNKNENCGDWCPHFHGPWQSDNVVWIDKCDIQFRKPFNTNFTDERT